MNNKIMHIIKVMVSIILFILVLSLAQVKDYYEVITSPSPTVLSNSTISLHTSTTFLGMREKQNYELTYIFHNGEKAIITFESLDFPYTIKSVLRQTPNLSTNYMKVRELSSEQIDYYQGLLNNSIILKKLSDETFNDYIYQLDKERTQNVLEGK